MQFLAEGTVAVLFLIPIPSPTPSAMPSVMVTVRIIMVMMSFGGLWRRGGGGRWVSHAGVYTDGVVMEG